MIFNRDSSYSLLQQLQMVTEVISEQKLNDRLMLECFWTMSKHQDRNTWFFHPELEKHQNTIVVHDVKTRNPHIIDFALSILEQCPSPTVKSETQKKMSGVPILKKPVKKRTLQEIPQTKQEISSELITFIKKITSIFEHIEQLSSQIHQDMVQCFKMICKSGNQLKTTHANACYDLYEFTKELNLSLEQCPFKCHALSKLLDTCIQLRHKLTIHFIIHHNQYHKLKGVRYKMAEMHLETWKEWQLFDCSEKQKLLKTFQHLYQGWADHNQTLEEKLDYLLNTTKMLKQFQEAKTAMSQFFINSISNLNQIVSQVIRHIKHLELHLRDKFHVLKNLILKVSTQPNPLKQLALSLPNNFYRVLDRIQLNIPSILLLKNQKQLQELSNIIDTTLKKIRDYINKPSCGFLQPEKLIHQIKRYLAEIIHSSIKLTQI